MSFTSNVKSEISKLETSNLEKVSELSAIISIISQINNGIKISIENASVARRIFAIIKEVYSISAKITVRRGYNFNKSYIYILEINNNYQEIMSDVGLLNGEETLNIPKSYIYDDHETLRAYLRGVFLSTGSISDPKKSRYHLEFVVNNKEYAYFINKLLNKLDLNSKVLNRDGKYMIYIKEAEKISDFLRVIGASGGVLYFEDIRIYRDHKNMINRFNNCEQANVDKIVMAANEQIKEIEIIEENGGFDLLDDKVKNVAIYRKKYPYVSLTELSEIITMETGDKITKSGIHHRFKKIKELAEKMKKSNNKNQID